MQPGLAPEYAKLCKLAGPWGSWKSSYLTSLPCLCYLSQLQLAVHLSLGATLCTALLDSTSVLELQETKNSAFHLSWCQCCVLPSQESFYLIK